jgi:activator of HSP90 ATPase
MSEKRNLGLAGRTATRRQMITGVAVAFGAFAAGHEAWGKIPQQPEMKEKPGTAANQSRTFLHQEIDFKAGPQRIYEILLDSKQFAAFTGMPAEIDSKVGGAFSTFGGLVEGRNVELIPAQRIVQAWRPTHWDAGVYSIVRFELKARGSETTVVLDHTGFPEGEFDHLNPGWPLRYWEPLKKYLA